MWKELTRHNGVGKISDGGNSICKGKETWRNMEYLGTGEYATFISSELGNFSRK